MVVRNMANDYWQKRYERILDEAFQKATLTDEESNMHERYGDWKKLLTIGTEGLPMKTVLPYKKLESY